MKSRLSFAVKVRVFGRAIVLSLVLVLSPYENSFSLYRSTLIIIMSRHQGEFIRADPQQSRGHPVTGEGKRWKRHPKPIPGAGHSPKIRPASAGHARGATDDGDRGANRARNQACSLRSFLVRTVNRLIPCLIRTTHFGGFGGSKIPRAGRRGSEPRAGLSPMVPGLAFAGERRGGAHRISSGRNPP